MTPAPKRRRVFTDDDIAPERIVDTALAISREHGVDGITMRDLAERVDLTLPTVYRIIGDRHALLDALVERIAAELLAAARTDADLHTRAEIAYDTLTDIPGSADILMKRLPMTESSLRYLADTITQLELLDDSPQHLATRWRVLWTYVVGSAAAAPARSSPPPPSGTVPTSVVTVLDGLAQATPREQFVAGLSLVLDGPPVGKGGP